MVIGLVQQAMILHQTMQTALCTHLEQVFLSHSAPPVSQTCSVTSSRVGSAGGGVSLLVLSQEHQNVRLNVRLCLTFSRAGRYGKSYYHDNYGSFDKIYYIYFILWYAYEFKIPNSLTEGDYIEVQICTFKVWYRTRTSSTSHLNWRFKPHI